MDVETQKTARNKLSSHSDKQAVHGLQFRYQKSKGMAMSAGCSLLLTAEMVKKLIDQKFKVLSKVFTNCSEELSSSLLFDKHSQAKKEKQNNLEQWLRNWITVVQSADVGINRMLKECGIDPGSVTVPTYHSVGTEVDFTRLPEPQKCEEIQKPPENQSGKEVQESHQNENAFLNTVQPEDNTAGSQDRTTQISRSDRERDSKSSRYLGNSLRVKSYRSIRLPHSRDGTKIPGSVPEDRSFKAPSEAFDGRKEDPLEQKSRPSSDMGKWDKHPKAHSQDLSEKPEMAIPSLFKKEKIGPNSLNSKLDIYVGTSKGKTTVTAIAGLKKVIYVEKGKTEKEARPFHYRSE